ncbi:MAG: Ig-like domain-containing protein [Verrucomicrobiota bacterium]
MNYKTQIARLLAVTLLAAAPLAQAQIAIPNTETFSAAGGTAADSAGWTIVNAPAGASWAIGSGQLTEVNTTTTSYYYANNYSGLPPVDGSGAREIITAVDFVCPNTTTAPLIGIGLFSTSESGALFSVANAYTRFFLNMNASSGGTTFAQFQLSMFDYSGSATAPNQQSYPSGVSAVLTPGNTYKLIGDFIWVGPGNVWSNNATLKDSSGNVVMQYAFPSTIHLAAGNRIGFFGRNSSSPVVFDNLNVQVHSSTTTTLASSLNPSTNGNSVTFTTTVKTNGVTAPAATGSVVFYDSATPLYTNSSIVSGVATYATTSLIVGSHPITASYQGDSLYGASVSTPVTQVVNVIPTATPTTTAVTSSQNPAPIFNPVTLTATVTPSAATGSVQFYNGTNSLGTVALSGGSATYTSALFSVGTNVIRTVYSGDATYANSTNSPAFNQVMTYVSYVFNYDGFSEYAVGLNDAPSNLNGGLKWNSFWYHVFGSPPVFYVTNANLAFPGNSAFVGGTNALYCSDADASYLHIAYRPINTNAIVLAGVPATLYLSCLYKVDNEQVWSQVGFAQNSSHYVGDYHVTAGINQGAYNADLTTAGTNRNGEMGISAGNGTTYFAVVKVVNDTTNYSVSARFYNSASDSVDAYETNVVWDVTNSVPVRGVNLDEVVLEHGLNNLTVGEVRVGNDWAAVTQSASTTPPTLTITKSGGNVLIDWPATATGFTLYSSGNLTTPIGSWSSLGTGSVVGANNEVSVSASASATYFRLVK